MDTTYLAEQNFLVPNWTFVVELIAFILVLVVLGKFVIPPINKAMTERQERIRRQFEESEQAQAKAEEAEREYRAALTDARKDAARMREDAREQGAAIVAEMREQANAEARRILEHAHNQLQAERTQVMEQVRTELGALATTLAERILGQSLQDGQRQSQTVEQFLRELESQPAADPSGTR